VFKGLKSSSVKDPVSLKLLLKHLVGIGRFWLLLLAVPAKAQPVQWGGLVPGPFGIGYTDTTLWLNTDTYKLAGYEGPKPLLVGIWYPSATCKGGMAFGEYLRWPSLRHEQLEVQLTESMRQVIKRDLFAPELPDSLKSQALAYCDSLFSIPVPACQGCALPDKRLSTVVYLHGAQSVPFDNNIMCEYLASKGHVVISAFCNWPTDEFPDRLLSEPSSTSEPLVDMEQLLRFTTSLPYTDTLQLMAVGHSMGAQKWLRYDEFGSYKPYRGIVSLHTTLEAFSTEQCLSYWPELRYLIEGKAQSSYTPTVLLAPYVADDRDNLSLPGFHAFKQNHITPYKMVVPTTPMSHNGFISWENWLLHAGPSKRSITSLQIRQHQAFQNICVLIESLLLRDAAMLRDESRFIHIAP